MTSIAPLLRTLMALGLMLGLVFTVEPLVLASEGQGSPRIVQLARPGSPEATVQAALVAALETDEIKAFEAYIALVHPSRKRNTPRRGKAKKKTDSKSRSVELIRRYSWKRFRAQVRDYVLPESNGGFTMARMDPPTLTPTTQRVRIFVAPTNNTRRTLPPPIRLERSGERWLITANSL